VVKKDLENDDTQSSYLIYSSEAERDPRSNWLLDIQLYSSRFENSRFFDNKKRVLAFKQFYQRDWKEKDYHLNVQDLTGVGMSDDLALAAFLSLCSGALEKPLQEQTVVLGTITIGGSISNIENLSDLLQVCLDAGAKKVLIPISSASRIATVPPELFSKFQISFYEDPIDAVYKSLALS
jgi:predicted ATP-dependent Lon-type protease